MAGKRKKGKVLLIGIVLGVLLLAGGGGFALWRFVLKKPVAAAKPPEEPKATVKKIVPPKPPEKPVEKPKLAVKAAAPDDEAGSAKLAKLWNEVETGKLLALTKPWKPKELAPVLLKMDAAKVAELLGKLDPKRASDLSREMRRLASLPEPDDA